MSPRGWPSVEELLWAAESETVRRPGPKPTLHRAQVVAAGVEIADADGLDAVSMQRVAVRIGAATMALYRHVPGKNELVLLMLDAAIGAAPRITVDGWRSGLATWARANLDVFVRHPWTLPLVTRRRTMGPNEAAWAEAALRSIALTGLPAADRLKVLLVLNGYVRGVAAEAAGEPAPPSPERLALTGNFPALVEAMTALADPDEGLAGRFEFGLARVLDGLELFVQAHAHDAPR